MTTTGDRMHGGVKRILLMRSVGNLHRLGIDHYTNDIEPQRFGGPGMPYIRISGDDHSFFLVFIDIFLRSQVTKHRCSGFYLCKNYFLFILRNQINLKMP